MTSNPIRAMCGLFTIAIGIVMCITPFLPPESVCDIISREGTIFVVFTGVVITSSGLFNLFKD